MSGAGCTWIQILHQTRSAELPFQLTLPALAKACLANWPWRGPFRGGAELPQKLQQKLLQKLDGKNDRTICHWNHLRMFFCSGRMAKLIQSNKHFLSDYIDDGKIFKLTSLEATLVHNNKTLPQAKRHKLSLLFTSSTILTSLTFFYFFDYFDFLDYFNFIDYFDFFMVIMVIMVIRVIS